MRHALAAACLVILASCNGAGATSSGSLQVGPEGGSLSLADVTLSVPPGALSTPVTITITRTDLAPPAGYVADSPVYRFEPRGVLFASPATVTFRRAGGAAAPHVVWSSSDEASWETLPSTDSTELVAAPVSHFSLGFAGSPSEVDAGAALEDAALPELDAAAELDAWTEGSDSGLDASASTDATHYDAGYECFGAPTFSCATLHCRPEHSVMRSTFTVATRSQVTTWSPYDPSMALFEDFFWVAGTCAGSAACVGTGTQSTITSVVLHPGTYYVDHCMPDVPMQIIEPPLPPPLNGSCATSTPLPAAQPRVTTDANLYFTVPVDGHGPRLFLTSEMNAGAVTMSVLTDCDDPTSVELTQTFRNLRARPASGDPDSSIDTSSIFAARPELISYTIVVNVDPNNSSGLTFELTYR